MRGKGGIRPAAAALLALVLASMPALGVTVEARTSERPPAAPFAARSDLEGPRMLVRFHPHAGAQARADAVALVGGAIDAQLEALGITRIALEGSSADAYGDLAAVARVLARHPAVARAEPDGGVRAAFDPDDTYYRTDPYTGLGQWGLRIAQVDRAWDTVRGGSSLVVAVLDTGIDPTHPELAPALVPGAAFVSVPSEQCARDETRDDNGHGTHVAGIVGARGNDGAGVAGVAFGVRLLPLKVLDCTGQGSLSDVAQAITYAVDQGARVINLSLGSPFDSFTLRTAVDYASARNVLVVAAAGNCGTTDSERCASADQIDYPGAYPSVIAVGATGADDAVATFSSRNASIGVTAPGLRIVSTTPTYQVTLSQRPANPLTTTHGVLNGTSQAAPFVAGVAALVLSREPGLSAAQLRERIYATADDLGPPGRDDGYGFGRVNAQRAVLATAEIYSALVDTASLPRSVERGRSFATDVRVTNRSTFTWKASGPGTVRLSWSWLDGAGAPLAQPAGTSSLPVDMAPEATVAVPVEIGAPEADGPYTLQIDMLRDGVGSFSSKGALPAFLPVAVGEGFGASYTPAAAAQTFDIGSTTSVSVTVTNTGTRTWPATGANPVRLSYHWLRDGEVVVWDGLRADLSSDLAPGAMAMLQLPVMPPATAGTYTLRLDMVREGLAWFSGLGTPPSDLSASVRSGFVAGYALEGAPILLPGGRALVGVTVRNEGKSTWSVAGEAPVRLATHVSDARGAVVLWDGERTAFSADVAPGASVATAAVFDAPLVPGPYRVRVDLVREGIEWFSSLGVPTADADLLVAADYRARLPGGPLSVSRGDPTVEIAIANTGIATWTVGGRAPLAVSAHWYDAAGNVLVWDGPRTPLPGTVAPSEQVTVRVDLGPPPGGAAFLTIDLVAEGLTWFGAGTLRAVQLAD